MTLFLVLCHYTSHYELSRVNTITSFGSARKIRIRTRRWPVTFTFDLVSITLSVHGLLVTFPYTTTLAVFDFSNNYLFSNIHLLKQVYWWNWACLVTSVPHLTSKEKRNLINLKVRSQGQLKVKGQKSHSRCFWFSSKYYQLYRNSWMCGYQIQQLLR